MWPVNQFPKQAVEKSYDFQVSDQFLRHLQLSSVRFNSGGSGSFISPEGLLFTNHHVASDCIQKISSAAHDYMGNGFFAADSAQEKKCPDLELDLLLKIDNVTDTVKSAIKPKMAPAEANQARKAAMSRIEKECTTKTGHRCDVVTLYAGGRYDLYEYKKYTDVRLVFAPEADIAAFGGDPDNFNYPRYCLDFAFFRAYENNRPVHPLDYFRWSGTGVRDGELTFVPGNPGTTGRLMTVAQLEFARDHSYPLVQRSVKALVETLLAFAAKNPENARVARDNLLIQQNSYKAYTGFLMGLCSPELMRRKQQEERKLRAAVDAEAAKREQYGKVWDEIAAAEKTYQGFFKNYWLLEGSLAGRGSDLFEIARAVLRLPEEKQKPSDQRLREYRDSALPSLEQMMYSPAPISKPMETAVIGQYLRTLQAELGNNEPAVREALNNKTPEQAAEDYLKSTKLDNVQERKKLANNLSAVRRSEDGMIRLVRILDGPARRVRKRYEDEVEAIVDRDEALLAQARFAIEGTSIYPDATFTFRIAYGPVRGYESHGKHIPYATTFKGLYERATGKDPYRLPPRWVKAKDALDLSTPFNFVTTADTHGGNSGSPTIDTKGEVIGILFDGNMESLPNRFVYTDVEARSIHVAGQGIVEALRKVYHAERLLKELGMSK